MTAPCVPITTVVWISLSYQNFRCTEISNFRCIVSNVCWSPSSGLPVFFTQIWTEASIYHMLLCLPSDNGQHELQRWSLTSVPERKKTCTKSNSLLNLLSAWTPSTPFAALAPSPLITRSYFPFLNPKPHPSSNPTPWVRVCNPPRTVIIYRNRIDSILCSSLSYWTPFSFDIQNYAQFRYLPYIPGMTVDITHPWADFPRSISPQLE